VVTPESLELALRELVRGAGRRPLLLVADRGARMGVLTEVTERGRRAGLRSVAIAARDASTAEANSKGRGR
jgi:biopolymer transport protein ExbD